METIISTCLEWLAKGLYIPFFVVIIGIIVWLFYKQMIKNADEAKKSADKREQYLLDALDKKELEGKEDKKLWSDSLKEISKTLSQIAISMEKFDMRLEYIENKKI
jgi:hypothetical protein